MEVFMPAPYNHDLIFSKTGDHGTMLRFHKDFLAPGEHPPGTIFGDAYILVPMVFNPKLYTQDPATQYLLRSYQLNAKSSQESWTPPRGRDWATQAEESKKSLCARMMFNAIKTGLGDAYTLKSPADWGNIIIFEPLDVGIQEQAQTPERYAYSKRGPSIGKSKLQHISINVLGSISYQKDTLTELAFRFENTNPHTSMKQAVKEATKQAFIESMDILQKTYTPQDAIRIQAKSFDYEDVFLKLAALDLPSEPLPSPDPVILHGPTCDCLECRLNRLKLP